jgi:hypothetical protein
MFSNMLILNINITQIKKVRMRVENVIGSSEFSDYFNVQCSGCDFVIEPDKTNGENKNKNTTLMVLAISLGSIVKEHFERIKNKQQRMK